MLIDSSGTPSLVIGATMFHSSGKALCPLLLCPLLLKHQVQFQLCIRDYFKVYELAQEVSKKVIDLIGWINNHSKVQVLMDQSH